MKEGHVFNIQRYSLHDGPGIRTTVFLSGCPLRCKWCANPESWSVQPQLFYTESKCVGCLCCQRAAAESAVSEDQGHPVFHRERIAPGEALNIARACPAFALTVKQKRMTAEEVFQVIRRDMDYYERSGGGVTFSGGEPLLQAEFLLELLKMCREAGIHTAVETTGCVKQETIVRVCGEVDLFLYDFKHIDSEKHREGTGMDNRLILDNLQYLANSGANIHVRVPVIPGFNDQEETLRGIKTYTEELGINQFSLLAFHQLGSGKYQALGMSYPYEGVPQMTDETIACFREACG